MEQAHFLVAHFRAGGTPALVRSGVRLEADEGEHFHTELDCARYAGLDDASYTHTTFLGLGSFQALAVTALGSAAWNAHKRRMAQQNAAPQWRPIGRVGVTVTSTRILMLQHMTWESIWFQQIFQMVPQPHEHQLDILFEGAPAVRLLGPSVPYVSVLLFYLLYHDEIALPSLDGG